MFLLSGSDMKFKGKLALQHSIRYLLKNAEFPTFWTFTYAEVLHAREAMRIWRDTARDLVRYLGWKSIRVAELHPKGHGLHIHAITPKYYDVDEVRHFAQLHGFGRIHVKRIHVSAGTLDRVAIYLSKYLEKSPSAGRGLRLWSVNGGIDYVRCKDVKCSSPSVDRFKAFLATHDGDFFSLVALYERMRLCGLI